MSNQVKITKDNELQITLPVNRLSQIKAAYARQKHPYLANNRFISFNQSELCDLVSNNETVYADLQRINIKFHGLCELICNYVIMENLLGQEDQNLANTSFNQQSFSLTQQDNLLIFSTSPQRNLLKEKIQLFSLNQPRVKNSHILNVSSFLSKVLAYLLGIYPHSLFSYHDRIQQDKTVNQSLLKQKLSTLSKGAYIKFNVFIKKRLHFSGHSMLIKKTETNDYSFFDPNQGEYSHLTTDALIVKINDAFAKYQGTHLAFIDGAHYLASLQQGNTLSPQLGYSPRQ